MAKIIAVVNQKGGVGKTSTAINLAHGLARLHKNTLLIDLDPSANASKVFMGDKPLDFTIIDVLTNKDFNINKAIYSAFQRNCLVERLFYIPSRIQLANIDINKRAHREKLLSRQLEAIADDYDFIIIDCPPMLSDFTTNAIYAANYVLIPIKYEKDALDGVSDLFDIILEIKEDEPIEYKMLRNGLDGRKKSVNQYLEETIKPFLSEGLVFKTVINQDEEINKAKIEDETVITFSPKSLGAANYLSFTKELVNG